MVGIAYQFYTILFASKVWPEYRVFKDTLVYEFVDAQPTVYLCLLLNLLLHNKYVFFFSQVVRKELWHEVVATLELPPNQANSTSTLRSHYARYLQSYELRFNKTPSIDGAVKNELLVDSSAMPPNATVTCSEVIIPTPTVSHSQNTRTGNSPSFHGSYGPGMAGNESQSIYGHSYDNTDSFPDLLFDSGNKAYSPFDETAFAPSQQAPSSPYTSPQYPYPGGDRRNNMPNLRRRYSPFMMQQFSGSTPFSQFLQQSSQQSSHPAAGFQQHGQFPQRHSSSMMGNQPTRSVMSNMPNHDPMHASWASQYGASREPEHLFDYPPGVQGGRRSSVAPNQFPTAPPYGSYPGRQQSQISPYTQQYRASPMPHSPSHSARQPMPTAQQALPKMKFQQVHPQQQQQSMQLKRPTDISAECVERTKPIFTKKRKLTSRDLGMYL